MIRWLENKVFIKVIYGVNPAIIAKAIEDYGRKRYDNLYERWMEAVHRKLLELTFEIGKRYTQPKQDIFGLRR